MSDPRHSHHHRLREWAANTEDSSPPPIDWSAADESGIGPLHALAEEEFASGSSPSAGYWRARCAQAIALGANPHAAEFEMRNTPLHWCARHPAPGCIEALIEAHACLASANMQNKTPEALARDLAKDPALRAALALPIALLAGARERSEILPASAQLPIAHARHDRL